MTISPTERALLESFIVDNEDLENLEAKLAQFNIFEAIGVVTQEIRHSNFLAFLLNPSQNHRLNDIFLKRFLKRVLLETDEPTDPDYTRISAIDIDIADFSETEVRREWQNIDILIYSERHNLVCAIENKVFSGEHSNQLKKYERIIQTEYPTCRKILIYLTPNGIVPSAPNWRIYNYSQIAQIIDNICTSYKSTLGTDIYTLMTHYSTLIRRHIVSDSEVAELCRKIYTKHKQALDLIFEHRPDLQLEMATKIEELVKQSITDHEIYIKVYAKTWIPFAPQKWHDLNLPIFFHFDNFPENLIMKVVIGPSENKSIRKSIYELTRSEPKIFPKKAFSDKWTSLYKRIVLTHKDYEDADVEELINKVKKFFQNFIKEDYLKIVKLIDDNLDSILLKDSLVEPETE